MDLLLNWLWQGSVVALALAGLLRLLDRAHANVRYVVCWTALVFVIAIPAISFFPFSVPEHGPLAGMSGAAVVSVPMSRWTSAVVMVAIWVGWASVCGIRFVRAMAALRRARAHSRTFPTAVESSLIFWRRVRDHGRRPTLVLSDAVTTAAVLGGRAPMIAVAPSLVATLDADELDRVVIHEWAHVQRRDDLVTFLQVGLRLVAGWHPAAWWIERRIHVEREIACDELTIAVTGSPKSYAECLVKLATRPGAERTVLPAPAALRASGLRARVERIVSRRALIAPLSSRAIAAVVVAALAAVSIAAGGLRVVGAAAPALPVESRGAPAATLHGTAPVVHGTAPVATATPVPPSVPAPRRLVAVPPTQHRDVENPPPLIGSTSVDVPVASGSPAPVEPSEPQAPAGSIASGTAPEPVPDASPGLPTVQTVEPDRSLWVVAADKAADQSVVIGRTSKDAGVATAGFFTRVARRVASSF